MLELLFNKTNRLDANWTDDCQGKKNYDGQIISIQSRFWPTIDLTNPDVRRILPSAKAAICIHFKSKQKSGEMTENQIILIEREFEDQSEEVVKEQVEVFCEYEFMKIANILSKFYNIK